MYPSSPSCRIRFSRRGEHARVGGGSIRWVSMAYGMNAPSVLCVDRFSPTDAARTRRSASSFLLALMSVRDARQAMFPCGRDATRVPACRSARDAGFQARVMLQSTYLVPAERPMPQHATHAQDHHPGQPNPVGCSDRAQQRQLIRRHSGNWWRLRAATARIWTSSIWPTTCRKSYYDRRECPGSLGNAICRRDWPHTVASRSFIKPLLINREPYHEADRSVRY